MRNHFIACFGAKMRTSNTVMEILAVADDRIEGVYDIHIHFPVLTAWSKVKSSSCFPRP